MTTFRLGQRVRIKWCSRHPEIAGEAGTIVGKFTDVDGHDWEVAPDCWGSSRHPSGVGIFGPSADQLEPLSDSNTLVSWESMRDLWMPEQLRVAA